MAATIEVSPLPESEPISLHAVKLTHLECGGVSYPRSSYTDNLFVVRCSCRLEVRLDHEAAGQIQKMAIGEEPHKVRKHTISSNDEPVTFKVPGEP